MRVGAEIYQIEWDHSWTLGDVGKVILGSLALFAAFAIILILCYAVGVALYPNIY